TPTPQAVRRPASVAAPATTPAVTGPASAAAAGKLTEATKPASAVAQATPRVGRRRWSLGVRSSMTESMARLDHNRLSGLDAQCAGGLISRLWTADRVRRASIGRNPH